MPDARCVGDIAHEQAAPTTATLSDLLLTNSQRSANHAELDRFAVRRRSLEHAPEREAIGVGGAQRNCETRHQATRTAGEDRIDAG
jgi:hypothetical protein